MVHAWNCVCVCVCARACVRACVRAWGEGQRVGCWGEVEGTPDVCTSEHKDSPSRYLGCLIREAGEIHLKKSNFNRDFGIILIQAWSPLTSMLLNKNSGTKHSKYFLQPPPHFVLPPSLSQGFWLVYYGADGCLSYFPVDKDRDLLRTLVCSPFNHLTWLLVWENVLVQIPYFLHYDWMVCVWGELHQGHNADHGWQSCFVAEHCWNAQEAYTDNILTCVCWSWQKHEFRQVCLLLQ
jgi:hypothetical protein